MKLLLMLLLGVSVLFCNDFEKELEAISNDSKKELEVISNDLKKELEVISNEKLKDLQKTQETKEAFKKMTYFLNYCKEKGLDKQYSREHYFLYGYFCSMREFAPIFFDDDQLLMDCDNELNNSLKNLKPIIDGLRE